VFGSGAVPSPRGALVGLVPQTKLQAPTNWNMKHFKLVEFLANLNAKPPIHEHKALLSGDGIDDFLAAVLQWRN